MNNHVKNLPESVQRGMSRKGCKRVCESYGGDYDIEDYYGDIDYQEPTELDRKVDELGEEWSELGNKLKDEFCVSLMLYIGKHIAWGDIDKSQIDRIIREATSYDMRMPDITEAFYKGIELGIESVNVKKRQ